MSFEFVKKESAVSIPCATSMVAHEYKTLSGLISGARTVTNGRYPPKGFCVNLEVAELVYVISGKGFFVTPDQRQQLNSGDLLIIEKGQPLAWEGEDLEILAVSTPKFSAKQHVDIPADLK